MIDLLHYRSGLLLQVKLVLSVCGLLIKLLLGIGYAIA